MNAIERSRNKVEWSGFERLLADTFGIGDTTYRRGHATATSRFATLQRLAQDVGKDLTRGDGHRYELWASEDATRTCLKLPTLDAVERQLNGTDPTPNGRTTQ